ncbi:hypothetical protein EB118_12880 [bacterium]|nr:hypothetical protein [bacterium]NDC94862.1 hypothetical protein [bacterium]NDD84541.1 hypothetical protein [bacterium]NDG30955.1 hypothetical protein [bacterium]
MLYSTLFAQINNCEQGSTDGGCLTNLPNVAANQTTLSNLLTVVFGVIGAVAVIIIIVQAIRFIMSQGESQKAADARRGVIYAAIGLAIAVSAEIIVNFVVGRL